MSAAPTGFLECSGGIVNISDYNDLFQAIGTTYNTGLSTQYYDIDGILVKFKIPDLRGEFVRGWDDGRGVDSGRVFGSWQKGTIFGHDNTSSSGGVVGVVYTGGNVSQSITLTAVGLDSYIITDYPNIQLGSIVATDGTPSLPQFTGNAGSSGTTRPRNVALMPCIKALKTVNNIVIPTGDYIPKPFVANNTDILVYDDEYGTGGNWVSAPSSTYAGEALLSANGYQKLPSGLIMQWGTIKDTGTTYNFPIPFTNACFNLVATLSGDGYTTSYECHCQIMNVSSFRIYQGASADPDSNVFWQAFGY
jgi:microcystin-dependent protein